MFSRSMNGRCAPFGYGVEEARTKRHALEIDRESMKEICLLQNLFGDQLEPIIS